MLDLNENLYLASKYVNLLHSQTVLNLNKENIENGMVFLQIRVKHVVNNVECAYIT